ncbi:MAG: hypothetical protein M1832_001467 [Thelocarpon impressellum]|nr:MAG: hypothetical protein M1832_001467 [Thelocarpon impressellum]
MGSKIIVVGAVDGQFPAVFAKVAALHAKNTFSLAIVVGDLFADPAASGESDDAKVTALLEGSIAVPLPTYFTLGRHPLPQRVIDKLSSSAGEVCENLYFLGKRTTLTTSEGVKLVALGGVLDSIVTVGVSKDKYTPFHTDGDAKALRGSNSADVLVTSTWPSSIRLGSKASILEGAQEPAGQQSVADLCAALRPRYHFSTSTMFYEREPFFHSPSEQHPDERPVTRFISLAPYGNGAKQKWIYAFTLDPKSAPPGQLPQGTTASPLSFSKKRAAPSNEQSFSRFSYPTSHHGGRPSKRRQPPPGPGECFFCLSNPALATHLITSIAEESYLTTARGPLSTSTTFPVLNFPAHILIIPLTHAPTLASIPEAATRTSTAAEMTRYQVALQSMLSSLAPDGSLGAVTWEVSRGGGVHAHRQFLPIGADLVRKGLVEAAFKVEAENENYPRFEAVSFHGESDVADHFRVWIWSPPSSAEAEAEAEIMTSLSLPLSESFRFDLQFGRRVLAKLLGLEKRTNWKDCLQSQDAEEADVAAFKAAFKAFDFSA